MYEKIIERYGSDTKDYTLMRARKWLQFLFENSHEESHSRLFEYIEEIKSRI